MKIILLDIGQLETNVDCQQFIETILPEAFRKVGIVFRRRTIYSQVN
jgi:hypothetical protein